MTFSIGYLFICDDLEKKLDLISELSSNLISWSVSLLAFILAGYSIFASSASKSMQVAMERFKSQDVGMSHLKKIHCIFLKICIDILMVVAILYITSLPPFLSLSELSSSTPFYINGNPVFLIDLLLAFQSSLFVLVLMLSKSFIFNLFHSVMTTVRWEAESNPSEQNE